MLKTKDVIGVVVFLAILIAFISMILMSYANSSGITHASNAKGEVICGQLNGSFGCYIQ